MRIGGAEMKAVISSVGQAGNHYVSSSLRQGLALGRVVATRVDELTADVLTAGPVAPERLLQFDHGGLGPSVVGFLPSWLKDRFKHGTLIVELPLWRPDDRVAARDQFETIAADGDVYAACSIGDGIDMINATIRSADPAYMYHAIVFSSQSSRELVTQSVGWRERLTDEVVAVLVGAYDGEGFVLCRRSV